LTSPANFGLSSLVFGALAIPIEAAVQHLQLVRHPQSSEFLQWLDRMSLVRPGVPNSLHELKPSPILTFTDGSVLLMLQVFGVYLAFAAILFGLWAEFNQEPSLLLGGGIVCGSLAILLFSPDWGLSAMLVCAVAVTVLRIRRDA
jgi:hypothetical protein